MPTMVSMVQLVCDHHRMAVEGTVPAHIWVVVNINSSN